MRTTGVDDAVLRLAHRQHGAFNRRQVFAVGGSRRLIERRLAQSSWLHFDASVYGLPGFPDTWHRRLWIAVLGASGPAYVAGRALAALHELPGFRRGRPEIAVGPSVSVRSRIAIVHRYAGIKPAQFQGFPVTTLPQLLFDLAVVGEVWRLERAMDDLLLRGRVTAAELVQLVESYAGSRRHGTVLFRGLVAERSDGAWEPPASELEARAAAVFARVPGLHLVRQVPMDWRTTGPLRFDFVDLDQRLIVEVDGRRWHARTEDFDRDRWRDNEAVARGWRVLRFTWVHITTAPDAVVELIARTIASSAAAG